MTKTKIEAIEDRLEIIEKSIANLHNVLNQLLSNLIRIEREEIDKLRQDIADMEAPR